MNIDLHHIRHALALGQYRNFRLAAEALHLTQPTLSRSIATLEEALGVSLFDRSHKGVTPTPFGRVLLERGATLVSGEADLRREIQLLAGLEIGSIAIGAGPYASEISVAVAVARVVDAHPRLRIRFATNDPAEVVRDVLAQRIDVGVAEVSGPDADDRLVVEPLPPHPIVLACRPDHPLAAVSRPSAAQVIAYPLVTTLLRGAAAATAIALGGATAPKSVETADFVPSISVNSLSLARLIARNSNALFPGTAAMIAEDVAAGRLVALDFHVPAMRTNYGLIYLRERTLAPAVQVFIVTLRAVEAEAQGIGAKRDAKRPES